MQPPVLSAAPVIVLTRDWPALETTGATVTVWNTKGWIARCHRSWPAPIAVALPGTEALREKPSSPHAAGAARSENDDIIHPHSERRSGAEESEGGREEALPR